MNTDTNGYRYYNNLDEAKADGYSPVKATSVLCFYRLKGRASKLVRNNIEPIPDLTYCILAKTDGRYYVRASRGYDIDDLFFYRKEDTATENLRRYVDDGNVWILFTKEQVEEVSTMLLRLYKSELSGEGKIPYLIYLRLLYESLMYEDYKEYGSSLRGFETVCKGYEDRISNLWRKAFNESNRTKEKA